MPAGLTEPGDHVFREIRMLFCGREVSSRADLAISESSSSRSSFLQAHGSPCHLQIGKLFQLELKKYK